MSARSRLAVLSLAALAAGATAAAPAAAFEARGSVEQVYVTGLAGGAKLSLLSRRGKVVQTRRASSLGALVFRNVRPGAGYSVRLGRRGERSGPLTVLSTRPAPPSTDFYNQRLPRSGFGYLTTRDGTKLAIAVRPPSDVSTLVGGIRIPPVGGRTPTLIEYAGYGYADPKGPESGIAILANLMGFTVVDVNMRGTGCSGGAYDFFEPLQNLDGYDVIETVARQPWVRGGKVGMMGISYGGISQLFTAQTNPPSLAAISPLSVIDQVQTTLYPGGILNTGFALNWAKERVYEARPASPNGGQPYALKRIQEGDQICRDNQALHSQAVDLLAKIKANSTYRPRVADPLSPITFVNKIRVPVFMACQWTDEQTGGHCPTLAARMTGTSRKWFTFTNGTHVDSLDPETFNRWCDFLQLYVARQTPGTACALTRAAAPVIYREAMGIDGVTMPADRVQQQLSFGAALSAFERLPSVRLLMDNGAGGSRPGAPFPGYELNYGSFPVPGTSGRRWYIGSGGSLGEARPARSGANAFTWNPRARALSNFSGPTDGTPPGGLWTATPPYAWQSPPPGSAASYVTAPLAQGATAVGAGYVRAWVRSSARNVDLQATVSEIRPDGKEVFVQNGWVRASERKLDRRKSRPLEPVLSLRARDVSPLPRRRFVAVTIPLYYQGHAYRAGSRIRVTISAPNGDQPIWAFSQTSPRRPAKVVIGYGRRMPSRLVLPVVPGARIPTALPPCPGLRGEPCRAYQPYVNRPAKR